MSATTISQLGQKESAGSNLALFLKVFSGEVLTTFEELNVMRPLATVRTIKSGKQAQFPILGRAAAAYHTAGTNVMDTTFQTGGVGIIPASERNINIDLKLVAPVNVLEMDELQNHYDVRSLYSAELGRVIAKRFDQLSINTVILAARAAQLGLGVAGAAIVYNTSTGHTFPQKKTDANILTSGASLISDLFLAAAWFDECDIPKMDRHVCVNPIQFYNLIKDPNTISIATAAGSAITSPGYPQFGGPQMQGPNGSWADGMIYKVAGINIHSTNHLPSTNIASNDAFFGTSAASANGNVYYGDFSNNPVACFHKSAFGVLQLLDVSVEAEWKIEYQATLMIAKLAIGMGALKSEASIELARV